jgi:hypothetical protein
MWKSNKHRDIMRRMKQGLMRQFKMRRCRLKNHKYSREEVKKIKNHK